MAPPPDLETLTRLTRLAQRRPDMPCMLTAALRGRLDTFASSALVIAARLGDPIGQILGELLVHEGSPELIQRLIDQLNRDEFHHTYTTREAEVATLRRWLIVLDQSDHSGNPQRQHIRAILDHNLGLALLDLGEADEALVRCERAVGFFSKTDRQSELARALDTSAQALSLLGRATEGLAAQERALGILRGSAAPPVVLANALGNLAACLSEVSRHTDALERAREAIDILASGTGPQTVDDDTTVLAMEQARANAHLTVGNELGHLGRYAASLVALREAVRLHRRLAAEHPAAYRPGLALALADLAIVLGQSMADDDPPERPLEEATKLFSDLRDSRPSSFAPQLAWVLSLCGLSNQRGTTSALRAAATQIKQAITLVEQLYEEQAGATAGLLVRCLHELSWLELRRNRIEGAETAARRAEAVLAKTPPTAALQRERLISALIASRIRWANGRAQEATKSAELAVDLARSMVQKAGPGHDPDLAGALHYLGGFLNRLERFDEAESALNESMVYFQRLEQHGNVVYQEEAASCLAALGIALHGQDRVDDALAISREAVGRYRQLVASTGPAFSSGLAASLNCLALLCRALNRLDDAFAAAEEAVAILRDLATKDYPEPIDLADAIHNLGAILLDQDKPTLARPWLVEAVERWRELATSRGGTFRADLAKSLCNLAVTIRLDGALPDAERTLAEALENLSPDENGDEPPAVEAQRGYTLVNLAAVLLEQGKLDAARRRSKEAIESLTACYLAHPERHRKTILLASQQYLSTCEKTGHPPSLEVLAPLVAAEADHLDP